MKSLRRYRYNSESLRYELVTESASSIKRLLVKCLTLSVVIASLGYYVYLTTVGSPKSIALQQEHDKLSTEWYQAGQRLDKTEAQLRAMLKRDASVYTVILDRIPKTNQENLAGSGGSPQQNFISKVVARNFKKLSQLEATGEVQKSSFAEIKKLLIRRQQEWQARPAIQPIHNQQLDRLHMTYGARFHPIFKVTKDHKGLDFAAPRGTPVYATGNGVVLRSDFSGSYGNVVYIDHGFGYETRYAHLSRIATREGLFVKRGEIIGYVGNTGNSVASHLHYEVLLHGNNVNPIGYFQRDLSNKEFEKLIENSRKKTNPLD